MMRAWDYDAVVYDGAVYCVGCLPDGVDVEDMGLLGDDEDEDEDDGMA